MLSIDKFNMKTGNLRRVTFDEDETLIDMAHYMLDVLAEKRKHLCVHVFHAYGVSGSVIVRKGKVRIIAEDYETFNCQTYMGLSANLSQYVSSRGVSDA